MNFVCPATLDDAMSQLGGDCRIVAGCTDFLPGLIRGSRVGTLVDITRIAELKGIRFTNGHWRVGATTTWSELIKHPLPRIFEGLKLAAREVGSVQIQNTGTIAGNICNASPAADGVPPLLALDAKLEIRSRDGTRIVALGDFITGVRRVALEPEELVSAVLIPEFPNSGGSSFLKLGSRKYLVISIVMVSAAIAVDSSGAVSKAGIAVGSCSPVATRLRSLERSLLGRQAKTLAEELYVGADHVAALSPIDDVRGSADYRILAAAELCRRAAIQAANGALSGIPATEAQVAA